MVSNISIICVVVFLVGGIIGWIIGYIIGSRTNSQIQKGGNNSVQIQKRDES